MPKSVDQHDDDAAAAELPLLNAKFWALAFFAFAVVLAVVFSAVLVDFMGHAH